MAALTHSWIFHADDSFCCSENVQQAIDQIYKEVVLQALDWLFMGGHIFD